MKLRWTLNLHRRKVLHFVENAKRNISAKLTRYWLSFLKGAKHEGVVGLFIVAPVRVCSQGSRVQRLGGKSDKTKELRSMTPMGFARAFYAANSWNTEKANEKAEGLR